jgi:hypothetical protein
MSDKKVFVASRGFVASRVSFPMASLQRYVYLVIMYTPGVRVVVASLKWSKS